MRSARARPCFSSGLGVACSAKLANVPNIRPAVASPLIIPMRDGMNSAFPFSPRIF
jgi:hypothetical protein